MEQQAQNPPNPSQMDIGDTSEALYPFPDEIITQNREPATQYACHILDQGVIERCFVMWVDASVTIPSCQKSK
jgi:hypothetical protein